MVFLLNGRFIFGPDARSLFVTMFLVVVPVSIFCPFFANKLMDKFSYGLGLLVMIVAVLFIAYGHEDRYTIYVHASRDRPVHSSPVFSGRDIRSEKVIWGTISMVDAEKRLLEPGGDHNRPDPDVLEDSRQVPAAGSSTPLPASSSERLSLATFFIGPSRPPSTPATSPAASPSRSRSPRTKLRQSGLPAPRPGDLPAACPVELQRRVLAASGVGLLSTGVGAPDVPSSVGLWPPAWACSPPQICVALSPARPMSRAPRSAASSGSVSVSVELLSLCRTLQLH